MSHRIWRLLPIGLIALLCVLSSPASADSHARVVRLSYVAGDVELDRATGNGFEKAILNMPVVYHSRVRTGDDGEAEIEFENGSTLRLTPNSEIDVTDLSITSEGAKITSLVMPQGVAFLEWKHSDGVDFDLQFNGHDLTLRKPAHLRLQVGQDASSVALYKGAAQITGGPQGSLEVHKGETLTLNANDARYFLAKSVETGPYDAFDQQRDSERQIMVAQQNANSYVGNSYYAGDLSYYGSWFNSPYGNLWRPIGYGPNWSPFDYGSWAFYPGFGGWNWVSGYQWGWLPFHYGNWVFVNGVGWGWRRPHHWAGTGSGFSAFNGFRLHNGAVNSFRGSASVPVAAALPKGPPANSFTGHNTLVTAGAGSSAPYIDPHGTLSRSNPESAVNSLANQGINTVFRPGVVGSNSLVQNHPNRIQRTAESSPVTPVSAAPTLRPTPLPAPSFHPPPMPSTPRPSAPAPRMAPPSMAPHMGSGGFGGGARMGGGSMSGGGGHSSGGRSH